MLEVEKAIRKIRAPFAPLESQIHLRVAEALEQSGIQYRHEARLANRCRVDFLVGHVAVEIKKARPNSNELIRQLERYAVCDEIYSFIVVSPKKVILPGMILGKPLKVIALDSLWGVALP